ncbi:cupin domain-containing protein [Ancylobacter sp.]|uniref:cupin domain-containing protein n=1 Tax=Ancylobacter sp. TaxID=1872567 RepID=UPI003D144A92
MSVSFLHSRGDEPPIGIPAIGLELMVRLPPSASGGAFCFIETINAPGAGPPRHRHREAEIFRVIEGRYLYEVDGRRFYAQAGDVVSIPGGAAHGFVNVTDAPARQYILMSPALDAVAFFTELAGVMQGGLPDTAALNAFGQKWQVEFLGPPLRATEGPTLQEPPENAAKPT